MDNWFWLEASGSYLNRSTLTLTTATADSYRGPSMARGHNRDFGLILITLAFVATKFAYLPWTPRDPFL
ncbi:putative membrane protein [Pseudomonas syringae pv. syringae]|nr:putative membrane protein [Pseudomonas syringae pv. syringae]